MRSLLFVLFALVAAGDGRPTANQDHVHDLIVSSLSFYPPTYVFRRPVFVLVDSNDGLLTTYTKQGLSLATDDPTANLVCREIVNGQDRIAILVTPNSLPLLKVKPVIKALSPENVNTILTTEALRNAAQSPWLLLPRRENLLIDPSVLDQVFIRIQQHELEPWDLPAYTFPETTSASAAIDEATLNSELYPAPAPLLPALCVSPDKPRPIPLLFAPSSSPLAALRPPHLLDLTDLTPAVSITVPASPHGVAAFVSINSPPVLVSPSVSTTTAVPATATPPPTATACTGDCSSSTTTAANMLPSGSETLELSTQSPISSSTSSSTYMPLSTPSSSQGNIYSSAISPPAPTIPASLPQAQSSSEAHSSSQAQSSSQGQSSSEAHSSSLAHSSSQAQSLSEALSSSQPQLSSHVYSSSEAQPLSGSSPQPSLPGISSSSFSQTSGSHSESPSPVLLQRPQPLTSNINVSSQMQLPSGQPVPFFVVSTKPDSNAQTASQIASIQSPLLTSQNGAVSSTLNPSIPSSLNPPAPSLLSSTSQEYASPAGPQQELSIASPGSSLLQSGPIYQNTNSPNMLSHTVPQNYLLSPFITNLSQNVLSSPPASVSNSSTIAGLSHIKTLGSESLFSQSSNSSTTTGTSKEISSDNVSSVFSSKNENHKNLPGINSSRTLTMDMKNVNSKKVNSSNSASYSPGSESNLNNKDTSDSVF